MQERKPSTTSIRNESSLRVSRRFGRAVRPILKSSPGCLVKERGELLPSFHCNCTEREKIAAHSDPVYNTDHWWVTGTSENCAAHLVQKPQMRHWHPFFENMLKQSASYELKSRPRAEARPPPLQCFSTYFLAFLNELPNIANACSLMPLNNR